MAVDADGDFAISDGVRVEATVLEQRAQVGDRVALSKAKQLIMTRGVWVRAT